MRGAGVRASRQRKTSVIIYGGEKNKINDMSNRKDDFHASDNEVKEKKISL